ncbi:putative receptor-recognizing phage tail fiber adhesin (plasmid) [Escherichia coli]|nr:hypothetical protein [Escherichia coli]ELD1608942.1 hypothetical protein [Escherichia coli]MBA8354110.1 putative receptor-recognizing phage tail fiber adhesin [Escherichia coli]
MSIVSGWVGSSSVTETSQRWVSAAGAAVRVGTPFSMSNLVGKSVVDFTMTPARSSYTVTQGMIKGMTTTVNFSGFAVAAGSIQNVVSNVASVKAAGTLSGSLFGCEIRHFYQVSNNQKLFLGLVNGPAQNFNLSLNGTVFSFVQHANTGGVRTYAATTTTNWFYNQTGVLFSVTKG